MVVDSSVLVAVVLGEPDAETFTAALADQTRTIHVSAATVVESTIVVEARQGPDASRDLELLLERTGAVIEPFTRQQAAIAGAAWRRFGKGRHPAGLNLGDCFSYAVARDLDLPLLYKGEDFDQTDIAAAR
jgi:ribonuclease VapC